MRDKIKNPCTIEMKRGWKCIRGHHTFGPCALVPKWWNFYWRFVIWRERRYWID